MPRILLETGIGVQIRNSTAIALLSRAKAIIIAPQSEASSLPPQIWCASLSLNDAATSRACGAHSLRRDVAASSPGQRVGRRFYDPAVFALVAVSGDIYFVLWYPIGWAVTGGVVTLLFVPETKDKDFHDWQ